MKRRIKLTIEYDGSDFYGWQVQAKTGERTVQGVLEAALAHIPDAIPKIRAAGRTDAGVHALAMVAHYDTHDGIACAQIPRMFNARLPQDVRVLQAHEVAGDFEAQYSCCYRRYLYKMRLARGNPQYSALERQRRLFLYQKLQLEAMQAACSAFVGKKDFAALATQETRPTVREVYLCRLDIANNDMTLHLAADGFLRNMVRAIVGTLLWVGEGKIQPEHLPDLLAQGKRGNMGMNAPAHGLYFAEAGYRPWGAKR